MWQAQTAKRRRERGVRNGGLRPSTQHGPGGFTDEFVDDEERFVDSERLVDEGVNRMLFHDLAKVHFLGAREENDLDIRIQFSQMLDGLTAIKRGHEIIQQYDVGAVCIPREFFQRPHGVRSDLDRVPMALQNAFSERGVDSVIIDDQDTDIVLPGHTGRFAHRYSRFLDPDLRLLKAGCMPFSILRGNDFQVFMDLSLSGMTPALLGAHDGGRQHQEPRQSPGDRR